jgi:hypothetical protein
MKPILEWGIPDYWAISVVSWVAVIRVAGPDSLKCSDWDPIVLVTTTKLKSILNVQKFYFLKLFFILY